MKRAVRAVIQIIAVCVLIFALLEIGLEIAHHQIQVRNHVNPIKTNVWRYIIAGVLVVVGFILFAGSNSLAEQLTDDIDDTNDIDVTDDTEE
jgi:hypothetical protein